MSYKLIAAGLIACCLLTACAPEKDPPVTGEGEDTDTVTTPVQTDEPLPPIIGPSFPGTVQSGIGEMTERYDYTEGEHTVLSVSLTLPVANIKGNDALQTTLSGRLEEVYTTLKKEIDGLYQQYLADFRAGREFLTTPSVQVRFTLHYFTAEAVSMTYLFTETASDGIVYTRSAHSNLDLRVGSEIRLSALLKDGKNDAVLAILTEKLQSAPPEGLYENAIRNLAARLDSAWYIADGSLSVYLEAGEIAPISSGSILLTLTKSELSLILSDYGNALL